MSISQNINTQMSVIITVSSALASAPLVPRTKVTPRECGSGSFQLAVCPGGLVTPVTLEY